MKKLQQVLMLAVCLLILMVAAVQRDGKLWGNSLKAAKADSLKTARIDTMRTLDDGTKVINTTMLGKDITGYGGAVPLEIYVKDTIACQMERQDHRRSTAIEGRCRQWSHLLVARNHRKHEARTGLRFAKSRRAKHTGADGPQCKNRFGTLGCALGCHCSAVLSKQTLPHGAAFAQRCGAGLRLWYVPFVVAVRQFRVKRH